MPSNLWSPGPLGPQQLASQGGGMGAPGMGGMPGMMGGMPDLPPSLAMRMARMSQNNRLQSPLAQTLMQTPLPQVPVNMEPFAPTPLAKPKEFYEQQYMPTDSQRSNSLQNALQTQPLGGVPGELPGQIPNNPLSQALGQLPGDLQDRIPGMAPPAMTNLSPDGQAQDQSQPATPQQGLLSGLFSSSSPTRDDTLNQIYGMYASMMGGY